MLLLWCLVSGALIAGERLHNSIVLPDVWPPANNNAAVCAIPETISIDVGRQLFVDDFLIGEMDGVERIFPVLQVADETVFRTGEMLQMAFLGCGIARGIPVWCAWRFLPMALIGRTRNWRCLWI